jgi:DNA-binding transcriptional LysR family regulator
LAHPQHGTPQHPSELDRHRLIASDAGPPPIAWRFEHGGAEFQVGVKPLMLVNNLDTAIEAALCGWAMSRTLSYQVAPHVADGRLAIVLPEFEPKPLPIHVVHQEGRRASAKLRAFVDFIVDRLRADPAFKG